MATSRRSSTGTNSSRRGRTSSSRSSTSRRGFAAMDPEEHRETSAMGGRASHGGRGREYYSDRDEDHEDDNLWSRRGGYSMRGQRDFDEDDYDDDERDNRYDDEDESSNSGYSMRGQNDYYDDDDRYNEDEDDDESRGFRGRSRRGFAAMDPEGRREIAARGGRASHGSGRGPSRRRSTTNYR